MLDIFSSTLPRSSMRLCSCLIGSRSSTQLTESQDELLRTACCRAHHGIGALRQAHRLGGDQLQDITPAEAPAAPDAVTRNHAFFSKLIHRLEMYLEQRGDF